MAFDFRLERILKVADSEKKNLEAQYQSLYDHLENIAQDLVQLLGQKKDAQIRLQNKMKKAITIDSMKLQLSDADQMDQLIARRTMQYEKLKQQLEQMQAILLEKSIEVKKYEKMKEKQRQNYRTEQRKSEMKQMDEIAVLHGAING